MIDCSRTFLNTVLTSRQFVESTGFKFYVAKSEDSILTLMHSKYRACLVSSLANLDELDVNSVNTILVGSNKTLLVTTFKTSQFTKLVESGITSQDSTVKDWLVFLQNLHKVGSSEPLELIETVIEDSTVFKYSLSLERN